MLRVFLFGNIALIVLMGCNSGNEQQASSESWVATLNNGDKPGNGYEMIVRDGRVSGGAFYLLDPNKPHDLKSAGQTAAFEDVKHSGTKVTFSFTLREGEGKLKLAMTISLLDELTGDVGKTAKAKAEDNDGSGAIQDLVFTRRK